MYAKKIKYKDFNDNEREETFYFNLSKSEIIDLEWRTPGGIENYMHSIVSSLDGQKLADFFKMLIDKSYGVKTPDGRSFVKNAAVLENFKFTNAYDILYVQLATDTDAATEFFTGIFPKDIVEEAKKQKSMADKAGIQLIKNVQPEPIYDPQLAALQQAPAVPMVEGQVVSQPVTPTVTN